MAAFIAVDGRESVLATGLLQLLPWAPIFQADSVAQRVALEWCQGHLHEGG